MCCDSSAFLEAGINAKISGIGISNAIALPMKVHRKPTDSYRKPPIGGPAIALKIRDAMLGRTLIQ